MPHEKYHRLLSLLRELQPVLLAFSGGVDSTLLLKALKDAGVKFCAVTAVSATMPEREQRAAEELARFLSADHRVIRTEELSNPDFVRNPRDRCFHCKDELFSRLTEMARAEGFASVVDGSNADDCADWRPGRRAAEKHGVRSPLIEAGLTKEEIRELSRSLGLPTWSKPASPCLSSRFPYGREITLDGLKRVEGAEDILREFGFSDVRVRFHGDLARIEVPASEIERFCAAGLRETVAARLQGLGFRYVTIDLAGFRSGNLNF